MVWNGAEHRVHTEWQRPLSSVHSIMMEKFTEWQWPISGVHSIMMEKSALAGEGEGCTPNHFHYFTITYKVAVAVYSPAAGRADTLTLFISTPMYSVVRAEQVL